MALTKHGQTRCSQVWKFLLETSLGIVLLAGCNNTCFVFTSNPPTGTVNIKVSDQKPPCMLTTANGAVQLLAHADFTCSSCAPSTRIAHLFVSLRGIQIHPSANADGGSPDWYELLPQLLAQPRQFDLVSSTASHGAPLPLGEDVTIPADTYRQLRLSFVPNQPALDDPTPEQNACGRMGFNCVVSEDDRIYPLVFDGASPKLSITSNKIAGGGLLIPPDSDSNLVIEVNAVWSLSSSAGQGVRLQPVLMGSARVERRASEPRE
jgi:Domain of unknown function (DUF4382)